MIQVTASMSLHMNKENHIFFLFIVVFSVLTYPHTTLVLMDDNQLELFTVKYILRY